MFGFGFGFVGMVAVMFVLVACLAAGLVEA